MSNSRSTRAGRRLAAKEVRTLLDSIKLKVFATHTEPEFFVPGDKMKAMIELNHILGTQTVCCVRGLATTPTGIGYHAKASAENDAWKELTDVLQSAAETLKKNKMACSFHNHAVEFQTKDGVQARSTSWRKSKDLVFHIDVNVCRRAGTDPVAFMKQYPGQNRMPAAHRRPRGRQPARAAASARATRPWKDVFATAESVGGVKYYLLTHGATEYDAAGNGEAGPGAVQADPRLMGRLNDRRGKPQTVRPLPRQASQSGVVAGSLAQLESRIREEFLRDVDRFRLAAEAHEQIDQDGRGSLSGRVEFFAEVLDSGIAIFAEQRLQVHRMITIDIFERRVAAEVKHGGEPAPVLRHLQTHAQ